MFICWRESGGLDLPEDQVRGSPNRGYSLSQARANFEDHEHLYDDEFQPD